MKSSYHLITALFMGLFPLDVVAQKANENGEQAQHFAYDGADGHIDDIVDEPRRGADEAEQTDGLGVLQTEADGGGGHADDRQQLQQGVARGEGLTEHRKGQHIGGGKNGLKEDEPADMGGVQLFFVHVDDGAERGHGVEDAAHRSTQHKETDRKQRAAEHLEQNDPVGGLHLEGIDVECHGENANRLGDKVVSSHVFSSFLHFCSL